MTRRAKQYVLMEAEDCFPPHALDLRPGSRDSIKVEWLEKAFRENGFDTSYPALVGYPLDHGVQLLSGTHRREAARRTGTKLPVTLFLRSDIEAHWGTERWKDVMADIPVRDLAAAPVLEGNDGAALADRVNPKDW